MASCTMKYKIHVNQDYSAHIKLDVISMASDLGVESISEPEISDSSVTFTEIELANEESDSTETESVNYAEIFRNYYVGQAISNLSVTEDSTKIRIEFDISRIDHLSDYMTPIDGYEYGMKFISSKKSLILQGDPGNPEAKALAFMYDLVELEMMLTFDRGIKKVKTKNEYAYSAGNAVYIKTTLGQLKAYDGENKVTIKLGK